MKILLLADLHSERPWYRWVLSEIAQYDLVCIAGDLIDMFRRPDDQIHFLREEWLLAFVATGKPLAICSGNHDFSIAMWLSLMTYPNVIADGQSQLLNLANSEQLVVTTCPYRGSFSERDEDTRSLWQLGAKLRQQHEVPWLVLHHEPPDRLSLEPVFNKLGFWIERFSPNYVSSGHFHQSPAVLGRFSTRINSTWCFNSGCVPGTPIPNHTVLDTTERTAAWREMSADGCDQTKVIVLS